MAMSTSSSGSTSKRMRAIRSVVFLTRSIVTSTEATTRCSSGCGDLRHLEVLKFARSQSPPCPWWKKTCSEAAGGGRLEVLKWLRSQSPPCPWDADTCSEAAMNWAAGSVEVGDAPEDRPSVLDLPEDVVELLKAEGFFDGEG
eukprot:CAMPEP_0198462440 /NCGR_PEP_ID=MMETSP1456-20131121/926_1 /TAXON_ID=1461544 ORGANISM="Unidentified sp., Strain RCC1871" /NCGR_SAMPLE_ID=MMETSP1456 /ASSEMBLY_ACC=CAM_ASM_001119 /LENGTH=142 /DNA_ID=CAMNT_0044187643 /DNA_START=173 /DNA_END=602 /DNA_ORIENTATION=+